jgi:hypothetical protein
MITQVGSNVRTWLTSEQAQTELTQDVLSKHRGSSAGAKPTVANVREQAKRWKEMIALAEKTYGELEGAWAARFVVLLTESRARTLSAVQKAYSTTIREREEQQRRDAEQTAGSVVDLNAYRQSRDL